MKKLLYTILAVSVIFSSCKKEDETSSFTGTWEVTFDAVTDTTTLTVSSDGSLSGSLVASILTNPANITGCVTNGGTLTGEAIAETSTGQVTYLLNGTLSGNAGSGTLAIYDSPYLEGWSAVKQ